MNALEQVERTLSVAAYPREDIDLEAVAEVCAALRLAVAPIPMILYCPACGMQHIDANEQHGKLHAPICNISCGMHGCTCGFDNLWTNPPHRSHLCAGCGHVWRPADVCTTGVATIETKGKNDSLPVERSQ